MDIDRVGTPMPLSQPHPGQNSCTPPLISNAQLALQINGTGWFFHLLRKCYVC